MKLNLRMSTMRPLVAVCVAGALLLGGCESGQHKADTLSIGPATVLGEGVGFYGYGFRIPSGYKAESFVEMPEKATAYRSQFPYHKAAYNYVRDLHSHEGNDYHFHKSVFLSKGMRRIVVTPVRVREVTSFSNYPLDLRREYLGQFMSFTHYKYFEKYGIQYVMDTGNKAVVTSNNLKAADEKYAYEKYLVMGLLDEIYDVAGYAPQEERAALQEDLRVIVDSLDFSRRKQSLAGSADAKLALVH